jgi:hypothetical protein
LAPRFDAYSLTRAGVRDVAFSCSRLGMAYLNSTLPKRSSPYSSLVKFTLFFKRLQMTASDLVRGLKDQHKRFLNWVDAFWGYDVFIAHRRADASEYARRLYEALTAQRISCFIDRAVYGPGDSLAVATLRHVRKSTVFVLLGSPGDPEPTQAQGLGGGGGRPVPRVARIRPQDHSGRLWRDHRKLVADVRAPVR